MELTKSQLKQIIKEEHDLFIQKKIQEMEVVMVGPPPEDSPCHSVTTGSPPEEDKGGEGYLAKQNLFKILNYAKFLHDSIQDNEELEPWVQHKISAMAEMIGSVKHHVEYNKVRTQDGQI